MRCHSLHALAVWIRLKQSVYVFKSDGARRMHFFPILNSTPSVGMNGMEHCSNLPGKSFMFILTIMSGMCRWHASRYYYSISVLLLLTVLVYVSEWSTHFICRQHSRQINNKGVARGRKSCHLQISVLMERLWFFSKCHGGSLQLSWWFGWTGSSWVQRCQAARLFASIKVWRWSPNVIFSKGKQRQECPPASISVFNH